MENIQDILNNFNNNPDFKDIKSLQYASRRKKVYQFDSKGNLLCEHKSIIHACKKIGISKHDIVGALKGKRKFSQGYFWSRNLDETFDLNFRNLDKGSLNYAVYDSTGVLVDKFQSQKQISEKLNLNSGSVSLVLTGKRPHTKGFVIKYEK